MIKNKNTNNHADTSNNSDIGNHNKPNSTSSNITDHNYTNTVNNLGKVININHNNNNHLITEMKRIVAMSAIIIIMPLPGDGGLNEGIGGNDNSYMNIKRNLNDIKNNDIDTRKDQNTNRNTH